jgi:hypothetical protein
MQCIKYEIHCRLLGVNISQCLNTKVIIKRWSLLQERKQVYAYCIFSRKTSIKLRGRVLPWALQSSVLRIHAAKSTAAFQSMDLSTVKKISYHVKLYYALFLAIVQVKSFP